MSAITYHFVEGVYRGLCRVVISGVFLPKQLTFVPLSELPTIPEQRDSRTKVTGHKSSAYWKLSTSMRTLPESSDRW